MPEPTKFARQEDAGYTTLNESDSSYNFLFDENPALAFIINYERRIWDVNKKVCEVLGYRKSDLIGKDPLDLINPASRMKVSNIIDQLFNKEKVEDFNTDFITQSGELKNILLTNGSLVAYNKNFAVLLAGADITEANKSFREFEENRELFTKFMNLLPVGIFIRDDMNRYLFRNKYLTDNFDTSGIDNISGEKEGTDLSITRFVNLKTKDKRDLYCETTFFRLNTKELKKFTGGIIFDVTGNIKSERLKKQSEIFLRTIAENTESGIILTDTEGKIVDGNPAIARMTGFIVNELMQKHIREISHPSDYEEENRVRKDILDNNKTEPVKMLKRFITRDGETIWTNVSICLISCDDVTPCYFIEIAENITEQKLIKELFSIIAHDLRSHFHALLGLSELLADDTDNLSAEESRKIGKELYDAFRNEYNLLENLLAWSKIQKDNIEFAPDVVNLYSAAEDAVKHLSWLSVKKKIEIQNLIDKNVYIVFDANLLQSVLQNIISNAVKFSHAGSMVRIKYNREGTPSVEITDEGIGLTGEEIEKLLKQDIYFPKPGTAREQGTGLGLIICREFIEKHGGRLFIQSKKGSGTTVGFTVKTV